MTAAAGFIQELEAEAETLIAEVEQQLPTALRAAAAPIISAIIALVGRMLAKVPEELAASSGKITIGHPSYDEGNPSNITHIQELGARIRGTDQLAAAKARAVLEAIATGQIATWEFNDGPVNWGEQTPGRAVERTLAAGVLAQLLPGS